MVTDADVAAGLRKLGLSGAEAEVHASFRSFGGVEKGVASVVAALKRELRTILVPTFCWDALAPALEDIGRNAWSNEGFVAEHPSPPRAFDPLTSPIDADMGVIAKTISADPLSRRSSHPLCSWAARGEDADGLVANHDWEYPALPINRLMERNGSILLVGVTLTSCTAIHLAEEVAGRKMFIRWAVDSSGRVRPARTGGCSDGFDRLLPRLDGVFREVRVGESRLLAASLPELVARAARIIREDPGVTMCERKCDRCVSAVAGGPVA